jgi:hypothetical protein
MLGNGPAEETSCPGHRHQRGDAHPASRLAKDRHVIGIAPEGDDVLLHPAERGNLVEQAECKFQDSVGAFGPGSGVGKRSLRYGLLAGNGPQHGTNFSHRILGFTL